MATLERVGDEVHERISRDAFDRLSWSERATTNLSVDAVLYPAGEFVGPPHQNITVERDSVVVFADPNPMANFGHDCRYLFYDASTGELHREVPAQFPPWVGRPPETLRPFHEPITFSSDARLFWTRPLLRCPIIVERTRYALLYSGMSNKRHLNDLEFLYRTLIDRYGFAPENIYALSYDGTLDTQDGVQTDWPGDGTPYRIQLTGDGTKSSLDAAFADIAARIDSDDLLLVHTNNHGGYGGTAGSAYLCTYPNWDPFSINDFTDAIDNLPKFHELIVMMEQCHAGGFNQPIISHSPADSTSVASAATEPNSSYVSADGNWDPFARDWIAAQAGHTPLGTSLAFNPDVDGNGRVEAEEAFAYANAVRDQRDTPIYAESSEAGGDIALGREYVVWWWWCWITRRLLEPHYRILPDPEFYARLHNLQPELASIVEQAETGSRRLQEQIEPLLSEAVARGFGDDGTNA